MNDKIIGITKVIADTLSVIKMHKDIAYPKKKLFRKDKYLRNPSKRENKYKAKMMMVLAGSIGWAQAAIIISRPTPKGNFPSSGISLVGEGDPELIEVNGKMEISKRPVIIKL